MIFVQCGQVGPTYLEEPETLCRVHAAQDPVLDGSGVHALAEEGYSAVLLTPEVVDHGLCGGDGNLVGVVGTRVYNGGYDQTHLICHDLENPVVVAAVDVLQVVGLLRFQDLLCGHGAAADVHKAVVELVAEVAASAARDDEELVGPVFMHAQK